MTIIFFSPLPDRELERCRDWNNADNEVEVIGGGGSGTSAILAWSTYSIWQWVDLRLVVCGQECGRHLDVTTHVTVVMIAIMITIATIVGSMA